jgi:type IV pilus assembly protein PilF
MKRDLGLAAVAVVLVAALAGCAAPGGGGGGGDRAGAPAAGSATAAADKASAAANLSTASPLAGSTDEGETRRRARIRLELAASYYQQGNYRVAIDELRQALAIDPGYAQAHGMLGLVYMDLNDRPRAEESFQRALRLAPADSDLNNNYGWYLCQTGQPARAIEHFQIALRNPLYATPARPLHNAGICSLRMGDEKAAEDYFQRSFQVDPGNPVAMFNLAELNLKRGDFAKARFHSQRLVGAFEPSAEVLWQAIRIEHSAGNLDSRDSLASQLRRRFPASREASLLAAGRFGG